MFASSGRVLTDDTLVQPARLQTAWFPKRRKHGSRSTEVPSEAALPLLSPACQQQQLVRSAKALCTTTLAKCTGLIALLNVLETVPCEHVLFTIHSKETVPMCATSMQKRDRCQLNFSLAINRTPLPPHLHRTPSSRQHQTEGTPQSRWTNRKSSPPLRPRCATEFFEVVVTQTHNRCGALCQLPRSRRFVLVCLGMCRLLGKTICKLFERASQLKMRMLAKNKYIKMEVLYRLGCNTSSLFLNN